MKKIILLLVLSVTQVLQSQEFSADLQLRPRLEFRNGFKTLLSAEEDPATFISQRSRLILGLSEDALQVKLSMQNIGVWGDSPTMRLEDSNAFSLFEAYGQYQASPDVMFRVGRQVLAYDNQRILGEVNWAQQGQSHDAALLSWIPAARHRLDLGAAYNAPAETLAEVPYIINSYKNLQFAWYHMDVNNVGFSFLLMNTGYEYDKMNVGREVDYIQTYGAFHQFLSGNLYGDVAAYGQSGSRNGREIAAWYASLNLNYRFTSAWSTGIGAEYLSGTDRNDFSGRSFSFTPLFGTNHGFNGLMDYFYVGNHQNDVGLLDVYGRISWKSPTLELTLMPHVFSSAAEFGEDYDNFLGTEIDLVGMYKVRKDLSLGFGYSQMFGTESLELLKGGDAGKNQNWAWLMVNFNPNLFKISKSEVPANMR